MTVNEKRVLLGCCSNVKKQIKSLDTTAKRIKEIAYDLSDPKTLEYNEQTYDRFLNDLASRMELCYEAVCSRMDEIMMDVIDQEEPAPEPKKEEKPQNNNHSTETYPPKYDPTLIRC